MAEQGYIYDAAWEQERARLASLESLNDPYTKMHCEQLGLREGWHCLEVGGGGGSIVEWLAARVGAAGHVMATDLDTRFLQAIDADNVEVRRHDIVNDDLEENAFDLVHSRFLLEHLPERARALDTMIAAAKPGAWILMEDVDLTEISRPDDMAVTNGELRAKYFAGLRSFMMSRGIDPDYGGRLPRALLDHGLDGVGAATRRQLMLGGDESASVAKLSTLALKDAMTSAGYVTAEEVDELLGMLDAPTTMGLSPTVVAAWGRKPA